MPTRSSITDQPDRRKPDLAVALREQFGFASFRPGQRQAMEYVLAGRNALVVMPTGSGKSLCYQLPALLSGATTLVISPLIALMKDQVDSLVAASKRATFINSTLSPAEQRSRLAGLARGEYAIIYCAPERLRNTDLVQALGRIRVGMVAVDEAHCISQWGHDFRPDYLTLSEFIPRLGAPPVLALTATATPQVQDDIVRQLGLAHAERIVTGFNRPNLSLRVRYTPGVDAKRRELQALLRKETPAIVYTGTRREAEEVAEYASTCLHLRAAHYHAGLEDGERARVQEAFMLGECPIIVATNAFGMGVDKRDIRSVIHYNLTASVEAYYQEIGRAGRDGAPADGILLYSPRDRALQEWFIENDAPTRVQVQRIYRLLPRGQVPVSPLDLQQKTGLPDAKIKIALSQLESAGALERLGDLRGAMLVQVNPIDHLDLTESEAELERHRQWKREKLAQMVRYAETDACRRRFILDYFGDHGPAEAADCCDNHAKLNGPFVHSSEPESAALTILDCVRQVSGHIGRKGVSKILAASRAKEVARYNDQPFFGRLAQFRQAQLDAMVDALIEKGYIKVVGGEYPVVALSPQGVAALANREAVPLPLIGEALEHPAADDSHRQVSAAATPDRQRKGAAPAPDTDPPLKPEEEKLFEALRSLRTHLAREERLAPFLVLHDRTLRALARLAPRTLEEMEEVAGIGPGKLDRYGRQVISAIHQHLRGGPAAAAAPAILAGAHPQALRGPWHAGFALDFGSRSAGSRRERTELGEMIYRFKFCAETAMAQPLAARLAALVESNPDLRSDLIVPVPSTRQDRTLNRVSLLAQALAVKTGLPVNTDALAPSRVTRPQKELADLRQKMANVHGAYSVPDGSAVQGRRVLLLDDFYDSGATVAAATRALLTAGAAQVNVLTVTKTNHAGR